MTDSADLMGRLKFPPGLSSPDDHPINVKLRQEAIGEIRSLEKQIEATAREHDAYYAELTVKLFDALNAKTTSESKLREIEAETREECAKIAESEFKSRPWHAVMRQAGNTIAAAIRSQASQGEKK